jgi:hypothetical protein
MMILMRLLLRIRGDRVEGSCQGGDHREKNDISIYFIIIVTININLYNIMIL